VSAGPFCAFDLYLDGIDKQAHMNAVGLQASHRFCHFALIRDDIQTSLGGQFFALLRDEAGIGRPQALGKRDHRWHNSHLQIYFGLDFVPQPFDIAFLNVPPILAQMYSNSIGAGFLGKQRRFHGIRIFREPGLAHGRHVIDINP
jgi:hypothetical protein